MIPQAPAGAAMTEEEFRLLRDLIREHYGIAFADDSKYLVERRLAPRLEALRLPSFTDYYRHLCYAADRKSELDEIVERVTTNETYFFRERYQLDAFEHEILPAMYVSPRRPRRLHVWSAGCSTGEEAYTIAMLILASGLFGGWNVQIFGSDVSRRVLTTARRGVYGKSSFRTTDEHHLRRFFHPLPLLDGRWQLNDEVRERVSFGQLNLLEEETLAMVGEMDVIFCRNVLIYFDIESRRRVIRSFHRKLAPGGYLLLGHTESLMNLSTSFELVHLEHDMVYRKPA
jgi:chemotaxis protein methyltransferase CheR